MESDSPSSPSKEGYAETTRSLFSVDSVFNESPIKEKKKTQLDGPKHYIKALKQVFDAADTEGRGSLNFTQWKNSGIRPFIKDGTLDQAKFELYFNKIDADTDGQLTWDELIFYLLNENSTSDAKPKGSNILKFFKKYQAPFKRSQNHRDSAAQILISYQTSEYISLSQDSIRFWKFGNFSHTRAITQPGKFSCFCIFEIQNLLIVCTATRTLRFYDLDTLELYPVEISASPSRKIIKNMTLQQATDAKNILKSQHQPLFNMPVCIHPANLNPSEVIFFVGDDQGIIESFKTTIFGRRQGSELRVVRIARYEMHKGSVTHMETIFSQECYASSSVDGTIKFWYSYEGSGFSEISKLVDNIPINYFYFNEAQKVTISCGPSRDAFVWSQATAKKIFKLGGHNNQVIFATDITTIDDDHYIITITSKKEFFIWDSVNYGVIDNFFDPELQRPQNCFTTAIFDRKAKILISMSAAPSVWNEESVSAMESGRSPAPNRNIVSINYAPDFNQLIITNAINSFTVFDVQSGSTNTQHTERSTEDMTHTVGAALDRGGRKLMTCRADGYLRIYNYNSGQEINSADIRMGTPSIKLFNIGTVGGRSLLIRTGSDKSIVAFAEYDKKIEIFRTFKGHTSDIIQITTYASSIVSVAQNGEIISWVVDSTTPFSHVQLADGEAVCVCILNGVALVTDGCAVLHMYSIPRLTHLGSVQNPHCLFSTYAIMCIVADEKRNLIYSGDNLGYVRVFELTRGTRTQLNLVGGIHRCSNSDIMEMVLVMNGSFLVTRSYANEVCLWETSSFKLIGKFGEGQWDINNASTWVGESPFLVDSQHTTCPNSLISSRSINDTRSSRLFTVRSVRDISPMKSAIFSKSQVQKKEEKKTDEYKPVDFAEIGRILNESISAPPVDFTAEQYNEIRAESKPRRTSPKLETLTRPSELIEQFAVLAGRDGPTGTRRAGTVVRSQAKLPDSVIKLSRLPLSFGV